MNEKKQHVLVVDDDSAVRSAVQGFLDMQGFTSETAKNGLEGLSKIGHTNYNAVILDYWMPGLNGMTMLRHIRLSHPSLPVVMITGHADGQVAAQARAAGAQACLSKPFDCLELVDALVQSVQTTR